MERGGGWVISGKNMSCKQSWNEKNSCIELMVLVLTPKKNEEKNSITVVGLEKKSSVPKRNQPPTLQNLISRWRRV